MTPKRQPASCSKTSRATPRPRKRDRPDRSGPNRPQIGYDRPHYGGDGPRLPGLGIADALFSTVEQRLLALLYGQPDRRFGHSELVRLARSGKGATQRVLQRLDRAGLVTRTSIGNQKHYQANRENPIFPELHGVVIKTVGLLQPLRLALEPLATKVRVAFVYGSVAKGTDRASSDVDLLILSDEVDHSEIFAALQPVEERLARRVSPTVFGIEEWRAKRTDESGFVSRVARGPRFFVIGSEHDAP